MAQTEKTGYFLYYRLNGYGSYKTYNDAMEIGRNKATVKYSCFTIWFGKVVVDNKMRLVDGTDIKVVSYERI